MNDIPLAASVIVSSAFCWISTGGRSSGISVICAIHVIPAPSPGGMRVPSPPSCPCLDAPGVLHHVMARGIIRQTIVLEGMIFAILQGKRVRRL